MSQTRAYSDQLRTDLSGQTFSKAFVMGDTYDLDLAGEQGGAVAENTLFVIPVIRSSSRVARRSRAEKDAWVDELEIGVHFAGPCQQNTNQELDGNTQVGEWIDFVEEVADWARDHAVTVDGIEKLPVGLEVNTLFDLERLRSERQFRSMFTLTYRGV